MRHRLGQCDLIMSSDELRMLPGSPAPLGANLVAGGVNFALYSSAAEAVELCLFDSGGTETARVALRERSGEVWHGFVPGIACRSALWLSGAWALCAASWSPL